MTFLAWLRRLFSRPAPPAPPPADPRAGGEVGRYPGAGGPDDLLAALNAAREPYSLYGVKPLSYDDLLTIEARANNVQQIRRGEVGHFVTSNDYQCAAGGTPDAKFTVGSWMNEPPGPDGRRRHREIVLDGSLTRVGYSHDGMYWTASFR